MSVETAATVNTAKRREKPMTDRSALLVWCELLKQPVHSRSFGISEDEMVKQTSLTRDKVLNALAPLVQDGTVTLRLQQVGTAGTAEYFYKLAHDGYELILKYPSEPEPNADGK